MRIGIMLFEGAEELDWAGPWEVLSAWAHQHQDGVEVFTIAQTLAPVTCAKGLRVLPDRTIAEAGALDVVIVPGGRGTRALIEDGPTHEWLHGLAKRGTLVTSVCTGSLVLAGAGLLRNRPATTWWGALDRLRELDATIEVRPRASWTAARWSPRRGCRPASTWRCTWWRACTRWSAPARCAATSSTIPSRRSS